MRTVQRQPTVTGSDWRPTGADELLLKATLTSGADAGRAWRAWATGDRLEHLDIGSQRLLPALYRNLCRAGVEDVRLGRLRGAYRQSWYRNQLLFRTGQELLELLREAGIPTLVVKGAALAVAHYRDIGARPMDDLDVLVPPQLAGRALDTLTNAGWRPVYPLPPAVLGVFHAATLARGSLVEVTDLHWHAFPHAAAGEEDLWASAVPLVLGRAQTLTLGHADQLLHVVGHGVGWNPVTPIRWVLDAATIVRSAHDGLDWDRFCAQAERRELVHSAGELLAYLRRVGVPEIPEAILERLQSTPTSRAERALYRARIGQPPSLHRAWRVNRAAYRSLSGAPGVPDIGFVDFLVQRWGLTSRWGLPEHLARKVGALLGRTPERPGYPERSSCEGCPSRAQEP